MQTNNVSMLSRIFGYQDFDAVEFSRWSETAEGRRKQIAVVKSLLAPDVRERIEAIDVEVAQLKTERTDVNRDVKTFDTFVAQLSEQLEPGDVEKYAKPIDVKDLMAKQQTNAALIEKAKTVRSMLAQRIEQLEKIPVRIAAADETLAERKAEADARIKAAKDAYEKELAAAETMLKQAQDEHAAELDTIESERKLFAERKANGEQWIAKYEANNPEKSDVTSLLEQADAHNKKFNIVCQYNEKKDQFDKIKTKSEQMDAKIYSLAKERSGLISNAKLPIDGLTFTDDGLELNGVPFVPGKVSDSQIMEIAAKLVIASNPTVKVFRIARGESLGAKRLQTIVDIAKKNGFQGFIEQVQRGQTEMLVEEYTEACQE